MLASETMGKKPGADASFGLHPARLVKVLDRLHDTYADITIQQIKYLLFVAENPGLTVAEAYRSLGSNTSIASRTFSILSEVGLPPKIKGLGLVELRPDGRDRRLRRLYLTNKGRRLLNALFDDLFS